MPKVYLLTLAHNVGALSVARMRREHAKSSNGDQHHVQVKYDDMLIEQRRTNTYHSICCPIKGDVAVVETQFSCVSLFLAHMPKARRTRPARHPLSDTVVADHRITKIPSTVHIMTANFSKTILSEPTVCLRRVDNFQNAIGPPQQRSIRRQRGGPKCHKDIAIGYC